MESSKDSIKDSTRDRLSKKDKILGIVVPILCAFITLISTILGCFITHYLTLKAIDYERAMELAENNESEEKLLQSAANYFLTDNYVETIHIYNLDKLENNAIALNNLGYMYEHGLAYGKDIEKAREYYKKASKLGNNEAMENYILFTIKYPLSFDNLLSVLREGYAHNSETVKAFIKSFFYDPIPSDDELGDFINRDDTFLQEILCFQSGYRLKEDTEIIDDGMLGKSVYYEAQKEVEGTILQYLLDLGEQSGIYVRRIPVYINVPVGETRHYYIYFLFSDDNETQFIR